MSPLKHYKFVSRPNAAKSELVIGTRVCGIKMEHVTIECSALDFVHPLTQNWITSNVIPHMSPTASLVIVVLPRVIPRVTP